MNLDATKTMTELRKMAKDLPLDAFSILTNEDGALHEFSFLVHMMDQFQASLKDFTEYERGVYVTFAIITALLQGQMTVSMVGSHPSMQNTISKMAAYITEIAAVGAAAALRVNQ